MQIPQAEIEIRGQPPVEAHLLLTAAAPQFRGAEIHETEIHRFFELVGEAAGEKDPGDVGLHQLDGGHRMVIGGRIEQGPHEGIHGGAAQCGCRTTGDKITVTPCDSGGLSG